MTLRKKILLGLFTIPLVMITVSLFQSPVDPGLELAFYVFGAPIAIFNMWEWFEPEMMEKLLGRK